MSPGTAAPQDSGARRPRSASPGALIAAAAKGDQAAWDDLVDRFAGLVWYVTREHRLGPADAADVSQTTWLRLVEHLGRLRDPEQVGAWLATTARNECLRALRRGHREMPHPAVGSDEWPSGRTDPAQVPVFGGMIGRGAGVEPSPEAVVLADENRILLWEAVDGLPGRCRDLLRLFAACPEAGYAEISAALGVPIGSIGPARTRCLDRLRRRLAAREESDDTPPRQGALPVDLKPLPGRVPLRRPGHGPDHSHSLGHSHDHGHRQTTAERGRADG